MVVLTMELAVIPVKEILPARLTTGLVGVPPVTIFKPGWTSVEERFESIVDNGVLPE